jgi:hypothetical protein
MMLIERLKDAAEGSDELNIEIARAIGWHVWAEEFHDVWVAPEGQRFRGDLPRFSWSIDQAVAWLVPETTRWVVEKPLHGRPMAFVGTRIGIGHTPALALCIAALRAQGIK